MVINQPLSFRSLPPAIRGLIVVNGLVFALQLFLRNPMVQLFGLSPAHVLQNLWLWQLTTYMFLHGGFFHLLLNMYVLWAFGKELERRWGSAAFLWYYLLCGWGAAIFNVVFSPTSVMPSIGASGSVYGILVAFAILFPETVVYLYFLVPLRVKQLVILFAAIEFLAGFSGAASGIANLTHLGGMLTGYLYLKSGQWRPGLGRVRTLWKKISPHARRPKREMHLHELSREVDRILDKILKDGVGSLTKEEQELMQRYSKMKR